MDKLTIISGALFLAADIFAVVSLAMPDWIVSDIGGELRKDEFFFSLLFFRVRLLGSGVFWVSCLFVLLLLLSWVIGLVFGIIVEWRLSYGREFWVKACPCWEGVSFRTGDFSYNNIGFILSKWYITKLGHLIMCLKVVQFQVVTVAKVRKSELGQDTGLLMNHHGNLQILSCQSIYTVEIYWPLSPYLLPLLPQYIVAEYSLCMW